jgi:ribosomal protein S18 acetylase RimI-like enzyme
MVVTAATEATPQARGGLRRMDPTRDLGTIADLIADAFAEEIDERGRVALREMRWMARLSPLVWWWAQADPSFQDTFNGFIWEEPLPNGKGAEIVGNVTLNRSPGSRRRRIICNVVVRPEYQGQGIGRKLMEAAIDEAHHLGADGVLLQVHVHNLHAVQLYTSMGFRKTSGETDLRLEATAPVSPTDAPGYRLRPWKPADGQAVYDLARLVTPQERQWLRPVRAEEYRRDWLARLGRWLSDLATGRRTYRLVVQEEDQLVAMMTVTAALRQSAHRLSLLVHPQHEARLAPALVSGALHMLSAIPSRPVKTTVDMEHTAILEALQVHGFQELRTLLTLRQDFT